MTPDTPPLIDAKLAALLQSGISMTAGACGSDLQPTLARAFGCRISEDRRKVTIFLSSKQAAPVLACIRQNGGIAVVFSQPSTHRTVQLKGRDAIIDELQSGDAELLAAYAIAFCHELAQLGYDSHLFSTLLSQPAAEIVAVTFTPAEAFTQTPGPKAGERLQAEES